MIGGLGGAVSEFLAEHYPTHVLKIGTSDTFGCSGAPDELIKLFGLTPEDIVKAINGFFRQSATLMISFENVSKFYDHNTVLKNITFAIEKGEMAFITGPSGAGKSTLLKLMYMEEQPDEGEIIIDNVQLSS